MKRDFYEELLQWKSSDRRKPLILYGARQVGKTYIIKELGRREYDNLVYVNCYKNNAIKTLFDKDVDVKRIVIGLSALTKERIEPGKTLIFIDEAQEVPSVISSLKYFYEDAPEYHVVVAGSLLGVMSLKNESFPVGKVNIKHLYPMTFKEFVCAMGEEQLSALVANRDYSMIEVFHEKLTDLLRQYYYVGGMPEAVQYFVSTSDPVGVREIHKEILASYETDISKHTGTETQRVRMVWNSIPGQLARENKKFIYGAVKQSARAKDFEVAIQWLVDAGLVYKVDRTKEAKLPLKFYADHNAFKLYLLDVGLLGCMTDVPASQVLIGNNAFSEYKGALTENYVLQQMAVKPNLQSFYYSKDNSSQEIDFLVQNVDRIVPIEVKAESNVKSKSLHAFINIDHKGCNLKGVRFSMLGYADQGWMENIPLYTVSWFF